MRVLPVLVIAITVALVSLVVPPAGGAVPSEWTIQDVPQPNQWRDVAFGNGTFVAISVAGPPYVFDEPWRPVMTSPDGITWTARDAPASGWWSVAFGGGQFVVVGWDGESMTSPDGITWTAAPTPPGSWVDVTYGNGTYVAASLSAGSPVMTSPDGTTWTAGPGLGGVAFAVSFGNGTFVALFGDPGGSPSRVATSPDGVTWTEGTNPLDGWAGLAFGNGRFVALGRSAGESVAAVSADGVTWSNGGGPTTQGLAVGDGTFLSMTDGVTHLSTDGVAWTTAEGVPEYPSYVFAFGAGAWVGVPSATASQVIRSGPAPAPATTSAARPAAVVPGFTG